MNQPTLVDFVIFFAVMGSMLTACGRGVAREMLHTLLFVAMAVGGYYWISDDVVPTDPHEVVKLLINISFYILAAYILTWGIMKVLGPVMLSEQRVIGLRSRFWAGALALIKIVGAILGLNLWFAVHSPDAHPLRLEGLPTVLKESILIQLSDKTTDDIYQWLAQHKILDYNKYMEKPATPGAQEGQTLGDLMKGPPTTGASGTDVR